MTKPIIRRSATEFPMTKYTPHGEAVAEKLPRNTSLQWFVLQKKPTTRVRLDNVVNYELVVYTITETPPNPAEAKVNFLKVKSGQIAEQNEVNMSVGVARRHWNMFKEKGWAELPKTSWPKWLKDNVSAYGERVV